MRSQNLKIVNININILTQNLMNLFIYSNFQVLNLKTGASCLQNLTIWVKREPQTPKKTKNRFRNGEKRNKKPQVLINFYIR